MRVHYSDRGPNAVDQTDEDDDGVPDRARDAAAVGEEALDWFAFHGFAPPVAEAAVGFEGAGGSDALDIYLMDLSDIPLLGLNHPEACEGQRCATWIAAQSDDAVLDVIVSHEVFHAIQAAYDTFGEPAWLVEGSAEFVDDPFQDSVWNEGSVADVDGGHYLLLASCGLAQIERGDPDCGAAYYGTALLWQFLAAEVGEDVLLHTWEAAVTLDGTDALDVALARAGTNLREKWPTFAMWNLATGPRAGSVAGYTLAAYLVGVPWEAEGAAIHHGALWAPLSARYFRLDHPGGDLWVATDDDAGPLMLTAHPVRFGEADGRFTDTWGPFPLSSRAAQLVARDVPAGGVLVSVSHPADDEGAVAVRLCLGTLADMEPCRARCGTPLAPAYAPLLLAAALLRRRQRPRPPKTR